MRPTTKSYEQRFWEKVIKLKTCWRWTGTKLPAGYGTFRVQGKRSITTAHRIAYILTYGPIPDNIQVLHNCPGGDNKWCVRPSHLWLGTIKENLQDASMKGQMRSGDKHWTRINPPKGERHNATDLINAQVIDIRKRFIAGTTARILADEFHVTPANISCIVRGKSWQTEESGYALCLFVSGIKGRGWFVKKTHCIKGHEFTSHNTRIGIRGRRICRICAKEMSRKHSPFYYQKHREEILARMRERAKTLRERKR